MIFIGATHPTYMNPSRATIPLKRPHQCDSDGGRIRGVQRYYHNITEYGIKCCMHAHLEAPRAPPSRGELYRCKTLFLDNFPIFFFYPNGTWTHPPTSKLFLDFWNVFNFAKPLRIVRFFAAVLSPTRAKTHQKTTFKHRKL